MADVKISGLPAVAAVEANDLLELSEDTGGGSYASRRATAAQLKGYVLGSANVSFTGPTAARSYTLPDASATLLSSSTAVTVAQGGTGATTASTARANLGLAIGSNVQAYDADLAAIAALAGTTGLLRKTATNTWSLDTAIYLSGNQTITLSGDASGSGSTSISLTLANSGVTAGSYTNASVTVDSKGRITAASSGAAGGVSSFSAGSTGLTPSSATSGAVTLGGTLALASGGTGATTASAARTNLGLGSAATASASDFAAAAHVGAGGAAHAVATTSVAGFMSASDKTKLNGIASGATANTGTVTSVAVSGGTTGLSTSGGPVTTSGTITLSGTLAVANGGTGATSAADARSSLAAAASGAVGASGLTMSTARLLGRTSSSTGVIEEISIGSGLSLASGTLSSAVANPIPSGTAMLFVQTSAPTGWTKSTAHNNKALRVVSGTASSGGSVAFTTAFASQSVSGSVSGSNTGTTATGTIGSTTSDGTVGSTTLTTTQIPSHSHDYGSQLLVNAGSTLVGSGGTASLYSTTSGSTSNTAGGGSSHTHSFTGSSHNHTFTGTSHTHTWSGSFSGSAINLAVQYVDVIIATKD